MKRFVVNSSYRQFYVADAEIKPEAPEEWTDTHVAQHHNTLQHIAALCPEGDNTATVISIGPNEECPKTNDLLGFMVETTIEVPSGKLGVYGWPWELQDEFEVRPGRIIVRFSGYALNKVETGKDYYVVQFLQA